jgi:hypothetical protein
MATNRMALMVVEVGHAYGLEIHSLLHGEIVVQDVSQGAPFMITMELMQGS